ncbi:sperm surface protein Sp17-like [Saccoglossus kowalevskii]
MSVQYGPERLALPPGFRNILNTLSREILFSQPDNIYEFSAKYLKKLVDIRKSTGEDPVVKGYRLEMVQETGVDKSDGGRKSSAITTISSNKVQEAPKEEESNDEQPTVEEIPAEPTTTDE